MKGSNWPLSETRTGSADSEGWKDADNSSTELHGKWLQANRPRVLIDWLTTEIAVTTHRVVYKRGLIARDTIEINFNRIEGLDIRQSILGLILNFGTVIIRGTGVGVQPMKYVAGPIELRKAAFGQ